MDQRSRQPALREHRHHLRRGPHLGRGQPREPAHAVRQRPRHQPDRRGDLRPRRGERRPVGRHAGAPAAHPAHAALGGAPRGGRDALFPCRARHCARAGGLRGAGRTREAVPPDVDEPLRPAAAPHPLLVQRVVARPTDCERSEVCRDGARRRNRRGPGARPVQPGEGARRVRRRERAAPCRHGGPSGVPRPQRFARACGRARPAAAVEPVRRRPRSVRGVADGGGPRARRDAERRVPPRAGTGRGGGPRAPAAVRGP